MRLTFFNSAFVSAPAGLVERGAGMTTMRLRVRYGVIEHPSEGLVLIDCGYGPQVTQAPGRSLALRAYAAALHPRLVDTGSPEAVLARIGAHPHDVRLVILTHLHADHIARLPEFPRARIVLDMAAWAKTQTWSQRKAIASGLFRELLPPDFEQRLIDIAAAGPRTSPLDAPPGYDIHGDGSALAVPLPGHSPGHFGVLFPLLDAPTFYACDAAWTINSLEPDRLPRIATALIADDRSALHKSAAIARAFARAGGRLILCHDPALTPLDADQP